MSTGHEFKITSQNATHDRLDLSHLFRVMVMVTVRVMVRVSVNTRVMVSEVLESG